MVTDWRTLPWIVRSDEADRKCAHAHADAFEDGLRRLAWVKPRRSASKSGRVIEHAWRIDTVAGSDFVTVTVEDQRDLCDFDVSTRFGGVGHDATIRCSIDLLRPSIDDATALLAIAVRMLRTAADAQTTQHVPGPMETMDAVRIAILLGFDWSTTFEAVEHAASPLGPALIGIGAPTGNAGMPDPRPDRPNALRLRAMSSTSMALGPEHAARECDGFDVMETLRIHRELESAQ